MNEGVFELPDVGFVDRTTHDLDAELPGDRAMGLLVVRRPMPEGTSLLAAVQEHTLLEAKRLPGYRILDDHTLTVAGEPAIGVCARWRHEKGELYTREAHVIAGGVRMVFAITGPLERRAACDESLDQVLGTLRFR